MQHALGTTKSQLVFNHINDLELVKSSSCFSGSTEADANETRPKAVKLRHLKYFFSLSLLRVAVEDETSALQTLSSMERPAVSLH